LIGGRALTNADIILAQIRATPGQTDAELVERTGVRPHQQVRGICARLEAAGMVRRVKGPKGFIINLPVTEADPQIHTHRQTRTACKASSPRENVHRPWDPIRSRREALVGRRR
jgi:DNA-binding IclR family transcriptional regulator